MPQDRITLTVPAKSEYARTVRLTAASLGSRIGMSYDEVDDVRIAAEEAFVYAVETLPQDAEVSFEFLASDDGLEIMVVLGELEGEEEEEAERSATYATFILESVCDRCEFASDESGAYLRLHKRLRSEDAV